MNNYAKGRLRTQTSNLLVQVACWAFSVKYNHLLSQIDYKLLNSPLSGIVKRRKKICQKIVNTLKKTFASLCRAGQQKSYQSFCYSCLQIIFYI